MVWKLPPKVLYKFLKIWTSINMYAEKLKWGSNKYQP